MKLMFKVKGPLLKPKLKFFFFEFLNTHISHLAQFPIINKQNKINPDK
jgi:hypothetical protein